MNTKELVGILSVLISLSGYILYYRDVFARKTKPHGFTWFVWALITGISFFGQLAAGAGPGAWVMGMVFVGCFGLFILSFKYGERDIVFTDRLALFGALIALISWIVTKTPTLAAILITITDMFALIPTVRKSFNKPYEETLFNYVSSGLQFVIALFAIQSYSIASTLYPAALVFINWGFAAMLILRRRAIAPPKGF